VKITRGLHNADPARGCALTIGNFDGVHRGHQALLARLAVLARELAVPAAMLTFEPHPVELLAPQRAPARLTRFREKMRVLAAQPIEQVICVRFDRAFSSMTPQTFIDDVLCSRLGVRHLLIGDDFRFGCGGEGSFQTLLAAARAGRFQVTRVDTVLHAGARVSSTRIRDLLARGDLSAAAQLLGRRYAVCGRVSRGQRIGRSIGFPTANIALRRNASPLAGVYAVTAHDAAGAVLRGVANVGRRPTVGASETRVEVHLLDFDGDLYGRELRVCFHRLLRAEQRFPGLAALSEQIARDVAAARAVHEALADDAGSTGCDG